MKCQQCGTNNKGGQIYCQTCGAELDLTYDQIHDSIGEELKAEKQDFTEDQTRQFLVLAVFLMILSIVLVSVAGPVPREEVPPSFSTPTTRIENPMPDPSRPFRLPVAKPVGE